MPAHSKKHPIVAALPPLVAVGAMAVLIAGCAATPSATTPSPQSAETASANANASPVDDDLPVDAIRLDESHNYGHKYSDGILPVGDEHWSLTEPAAGTVFLCRDNFVPDAQAGARRITRHRIPLRHDAGLPVLGVVFPRSADAGASVVRRYRA